MAKDRQASGKRSVWLAFVIGRNPERTLIRLVLLVAASFVIFGFVLLPIRVEGPSMLPTYKDHRINFVNRLAYIFHEPKRGDVVAIRPSGIHIMRSEEHTSELQSHSFIS